MYTLEEVVYGELRILCPEKWQRDEFVKYSKEVLGDMGWTDSINYDMHGDETYFVIEPASRFGELPFRHKEYVTSYGIRCIDGRKYIHFDEFDMGVNQVSDEDFVAFLLGD